MHDTHTIASASEALAQGTLTARELVADAAAQADALDHRIGAFITRFTDEAAEAAHRSDERRARGETLGPLDGIPIAVKDIIADSQGPTTAQSLAHDPAWAAGQGDAPLVTRLKDSGAIIIGKTTTQEFAIGAPDPLVPFPVPTTAWDEERWAGGSSSGSASAVATDMALGAIGTDTAGSVRIPAAFNGITGLMPTVGRIPSTGIVPLGFSLDRPGPMARSAQDCATLLSAIAGHHPSDPGSSSRPLDLAEPLTGDLTGLRIGVDDLDRYASAGIDSEQPDRFRDVLALLQQAGAELVPVEVPMYQEALAITFVVMLAEAHSYHRPDLIARWDDYGRPARIVLAGGGVVSAPDFVQAQRVRRVLRGRMTDLFGQVDLVATPTGHLGAPRLDSMDPLNPLGGLFSLHAAYWNPIGNPTVAVPIGLSSEHTPLSLSLSAPAWNDRLVLEAGHAIQTRSQFHLDRTPLLSETANR